MNQISIAVDNIIQVLETYDSIKVYSAPSQNGTYAEISTPSTRPVLHSYEQVYWFTDGAGTSTTWYKTSYFNSTTLVESSLSAAVLGASGSGKVGYSFGNYSAPPNEWG